ncbi:MAG TPA: hypothetical protein DCP28_16180 [Cytophagales bacterium]|nr:hypothetical protein [Cytophagales bacterium]
MEVPLDGWYEAADGELAGDGWDTSDGDNTPASWLGWLLLGVLAMATVRLLLISIQVVGLVRRAREYPSHTVGGIRYCQTEGREGPSSFFRWIFLPQVPAEEAILSHEQAHVQQGHSWDIILAELWLCLSWWNPLAYAYLRALRQVHEYLADATALERVPAEEYLRALATYAELKVRHRSTMAASLTHASLTKRLQMMKNQPTKAQHRMAYLLLVPGVMISLMACLPREQVAPVAEELVSAATEVVLAKPELVGTIPNGNPIPSKDLTRIASGYGWRMHPIYKIKKHHAGVDFKAPTGTPIYATGDGRVVTALNSDKGHGNHIKIQHTEEYTTMYSHMESMVVEEGDWVKKGQQIGTVGSTGMSTAPHLHYEVHVNGQHVDPVTFLDKEDLKKGSR